MKVYNAIAYIELVNMSEYDMILYVSDGPTLMRVQSQN